MLALSNLFLFLPVIPLLFSLTRTQLCLKLNGKMKHATLVDFGSLTSLRDDVDISLAVTHLFRML